MAAGRHRRRGEEVQPARPRRRRLPHRPQVDLPAQGRPAPLPHRQRRRVRAGHLQGPLHHRARPPHAARGHRHHLLRARHPRRLHLHPRRVRQPGARARGGHRGGLRGRHPRARSLLGKEDFDLDVYVHRGAGAYICGEETALLESLEGKKGYPRLKPPFPAVVGLCGKPTIINNVETLANVPWIVEHGGAAFAALGTGKSGGTRLFCVSGHVNRPGVYEKPVHYNLKKLIHGGLRRHRGRPGRQGGHPRRLLGAGPRGRRDRRLDGVRRPQGGRHHGRLGRRHRHGRLDLHGPGALRASPSSTPRRAAASAPPAARARRGWRPMLERIEHGHAVPGDVDKLAADGQQHRRPDHLRPGRRGGHARAELPEEVPRRVRPPRRRSGAARSARPAWGETQTSRDAVIGGVPA